MGGDGGGDCTVGRAWLSCACSAERVADAFRPHAIIGKHIALKLKLKSMEFNRSVMLSISSDMLMCRGAAAVVNEGVSSFEGEDGKEGFGSESVSNDVTGTRTGANGRLDLVTARLKRTRAVLVVVETTVPVQPAPASS